MNYYPHHLGDYDGATAHLSWDEDMAYSRLLRAYYRREKPIPQDSAEAYRLVRAQSAPQRKAVDTVLREFFTLEDDGWHNKRADEEIERARVEGEANKGRRDNERERQKRHRERRQNLFAGLREHGIMPPWDATTEELERALTRVMKRDDNAPVTRDRSAPVTRDATATPLANSQEPIANSQREEQARSQGSRLPQGWEPDSELLDWAKEKRPDLNLPDTVLRFSNHWHSKPGKDGRKLDWRRTFQNWVLAERVQPGAKAHDYSGVRV